MLHTTFGVGIAFLVIALIAALFGFGMVSSYSGKGRRSSSSSSSSSRCFLSWVGGS